MSVYTIETQDDGKVIIGGMFTVFDYVQTGGIIRLSTTPKTQRVDLLFDGESLVGTHTSQEPSIV